MPPWIYTVLDRRWFRIGEKKRRLWFLKTAVSSVIQESARNPLPVSGFFLFPAVEADVSYWFTTSINYKCYTNVRGTFDFDRKTGWIVTTLGHFKNFFEKWRKRRGSTRRPADPIRLFHRPHLFDQGLFFLSADCPNRQDQLHSEQYQNEQPHFQNRELIRHYISGKSTYTHFSASKDGSRKPNDQRCQCCKERIAQPLTDVHFTRRLRNATDRINTAFFVTKLK